MTFVQLVNKLHKLCDATNDPKNLHAEVLIKTANGDMFIINNVVWEDHAKEFQVMAAKI